MVGNGGERWKATVSALPSPLLPNKATGSLAVENLHFLFLNTSLFLGFRQFPDNAEEMNRTVAPTWQFLGLLKLPLEPQLP